MKLLGKITLQNFIKKYPDSKSQIESWEFEIEDVKWDNPHEMKNRYPKASLLKNQQIIFNICGNKYRLWVQINYKNKIVLIKKVGTHKEYDNWNLQ
ncbi:MAG: type II toxin-antitoxin system HigB family toxin [Candidatus Paceibacterota bacterium]|jgi:mRNA interferase HigB